MKLHQPDLGDTVPRPTLELLKRVAVQMQRELDDLREQIARAERRLRAGDS